MGCGPGCDPPRVPHGLSWSWCGRAVGQSRQHGAVKAMLPRWKSVLGRNSGISFPVFTPRALQEGRWRSRDCPAWASVLGWVVQAGGVPVSVFGYGCEKERLLGCRDRATRHPARHRAVRGVLGSTGGGGSMGRGRPGVPKSPLSRQPQVGLKRI